MSPAKQIVISLALVLCSFGGIAAPSLVDVTGRIVCDGKPVAGVAVSDGYNVVQSGAKGDYAIKANMSTGYVFISIPAGYEVASNGLIPRHFATLTDHPTQNVNFELKRVDNTNFKLIVFADLHLAAVKETRDVEQFRASFLPDIIATAKGLAGERVYTLTLGDMSTDSRWYSNEFGLPEYLNEMRDYPMPIFHSMGNHDNDMRAGGGDRLSASTYRRVIGPSYYSFNIGRQHIVMLDNIIYDNPYDDRGYATSSKGYKVGIDDKQLEWLSKDLAMVDKSAPIIVCMHSPAYRYKGIEKAKPMFAESFDVEPLMALLKRFKQVNILTGHTHQNYNIVCSGNVIEHNTISGGGASWKTAPVCNLNLSRDGVPAGYAIYTIEGDDISWSYKATGMEVDECQFRSYDLNLVDKEAGGKVVANQVLVNVFNWDPKWTVVIKEKGRELAVEQVWVKDPLYWLGVRSNDAIYKSTAFRPAPTINMFRATAAAATSTLEIEVTDRFGNVYTQTMERPKAFGLGMGLGNK